MPDSSTLSHLAAQETRDCVSGVSAKDLHLCGSGLQLPAGLNGSAAQARPKEVRTDRKTSYFFLKKRIKERKKNFGRKGEGSLLSSPL